MKTYIPIILIFISIFLSIPMSYAEDCLLRLPVIFQNEDQLLEYMTKRVKETLDNEDHLKYYCKREDWKKIARTIITAVTEALIERKGKKSTPDRTIIGAMVIDKVEKYFTFPRRHSPQQTYLYHIVCMLSDEAIDRIANDESIYGNSLPDTSFSIRSKVKTPTKRPNCTIGDIWNSKLGIVQQSSL